MIFFPFILHTSFSTYVTKPTVNTNCQLEVHSFTLRWINIHKIRIMLFILPNYLLVVAGRVYCLHCVNQTLEICCFFFFEKQHFTSLQFFPMMLLNLAWKYRLYASILRIFFSFYEVKFTLIIENWNPGSKSEMKYH